MSTKPKVFFLSMVFLYPRDTCAPAATRSRSSLSNHGGQAVAKAQILAGGRGKGAFENGYQRCTGGYVTRRGRANCIKDLGQKLVTKQTIPEGLPVDKIYVVEKLNVAKEYYLAITVDRALSCPVLIMTEGGTSVEQFAASNPVCCREVPLKYDEEIPPNVISNTRKKFGFSDEADIASVLQGLYRFFKEKDASLVEINPLIAEEGTGRLICADSKVTVDNAAATRQSQVFELRDRSQETDVELEAEKHGLVYVQLDGNIGCLVNGAGLAMATNDAVAHFGGKCANFLDGGGKATKETVLKAFELLLSDKRVNTLLVNIYGGIIRCDMIAESIVAAAKNFKDVPVVVRLQGTNSAEGQRMIAESGLKLLAEDEFGDAVQKAIQLAGSSIDTASTKIREIKTADDPSIVEKSSSGHSAVRHFSTGSCPRSTDGKRSECYNRRLFSATSFRSSYNDTTRNLAIGRQTRVIYQGFTGKAATKNAQETLEYGTHIVGGVSPNKGGQTHLGLPVYSTVREAAEHLQPDATGTYPPLSQHLTLHFKDSPANPASSSGIRPSPLSAAAAITSAIEAQIPLIVSVAEHIPLHDMLRVHSILRTQSRSRLVGPNCPASSPPVNTCRIGVMPHLQYAPGIIGIVSRSGRSPEAVGATTRARLGTKSVSVRVKPVVAMVTGRTAPRGKTMGHAGAVAGGGASAEEKIRALERAGAVVAVHPGEIGRLMKEVLGEKGVVGEIEKGGEMGKSALNSTDAELGLKLIDLGPDDFLTIALSVVELEILGTICRVKVRLNSIGMCVTTMSTLAKASRLAGKVAIVTGAGSGYGAGIAKTFAQQGAKVVVADINENGGKQTVDAMPDSMKFHYTNVAKLNDWKSLVEATQDAFGKIDCLVNNAGTTYKNKANLQPTLEVTESDFDKCFNVNVKGVYFGTSAILPHMVQAGRGGSIINIASIGATRPRPGLVWYNSSKGAVWNATKGLAAEFGPHQIRVNSICPLLGGTGLFESFSGVPDTPENRDKFLSNVPLGRLCEATDVAAACLFFASDESAFVTGINMEVDGGRAV
ncbi:succinate--CoA ligase [ADP-forming] subunit beta, hydrogenosomal [Physcia stellaris]|nr:succinate--CoA ligase [ADP-forming] subunit beta, hydrogenosomal [Physcia stellaris]